MKRTLLITLVAVLFGALSQAFLSCTPESKKALILSPALDAETLSVPRGGNSDGLFVYVTSMADWTLEMDFGEAEAWANVGPQAGHGEAVAIFTCQANDTENPRSVALLLRDENGAASLTITQAGSAEVVSSNRKGTATTTAGWLELPATYPDDGRDFYHHPMTITVGSKPKHTRNYSYYYDYGARVAVWVAYPLNSALIGGSGERSEAWALDPLMPKDDQPVLYSGFGVYGIDRGHQIPSADRYYIAANQETFYGTNMTPQLHSFNAGIWAKWEEKVRNWSKASDTLYVVTGCVIDPPYGKYTDNVGKNVVSPSAYWKAVLRLSSARTLGHAGFNACAVYLEHSAEIASDPVSKTDAISIRELENKLGIDLFVNLPAKVGKTTADIIEEEDPRKISWWW